MSILPLPGISRDSWLNWRRGGIGASDIAAVAGLSPFATPAMVYLQKVGLLPDSEDEEWQDIARELEPVIASLYERRREGWRARAMQDMVTNSERPWMRATLDGHAWLIEEPANLMPFECKTTVRWNGDWGDEPPDYYQCQAQWQMAVTGADLVILAALIDGRRFRWWEIPRRQGEINWLVSIGEAFWQRVLEHHPPPIDDTEGTNAALKTVYREREREAVDLNADELELVHDYREARDSRLRAEKAERQVESRVVALLEGAEEACWQGEPVVRWSRHERTTDDMEALRELCAEAGIDIPKKTTEYRQFWLPRLKEK